MKCDIQLFSKSFFSSDLKSATFLSKSVRCKISKERSKPTPKTAKFARIIKNLVRKQIYNLVIPEQELEALTLADPNKNRSFGAWCYLIS